LKRKRAERPPDSEEPDGRERAKKNGRPPAEVLSTVITTHRTIGQGRGAHGHIRPLPSGTRCRGSQLLRLLY